MANPSYWAFRRGKKWHSGWWDENDNCHSTAQSIWGEGMTEKVVWQIAREFAAKAGIDELALHDLREAVPCSRR